MNDEIEAQVRAYGRGLLDAAEPVAIDEVRREKVTSRIPAMVAAAAVLALVAGAVALWAAASDNDSEVATEGLAPTEAQASTDLEDLVGVDWYFTSMTFDDDRPSLELSDEVTELIFEEDGTYLAQVCNVLGGGYQVTGRGSIDMERGMQTLIGCGGTIGDAENAMNSLRDGEVSWGVQGDTLTLRGRGITASLRATPDVFPETLTILSLTDHPASEQTAVGHSGDPEGVQALEILKRSDPSHNFTSASVDSGNVLAPIGLPSDEHGTIIAAWLPPNTSKAWVRLSTGGAEINLSLERLPNGRLVGWTSLPERSGVVVAFDADGNELDRSAPFDF